MFVRESVILRNLEVLTHQKRTRRKPQPRNLGLVVLIHTFTMAVQGVDSGIGGWSYFSQEYDNFDVLFDVL